MGDVGDYWREARDYDRDKVCKWYESNLRYLENYCDQKNLNLDYLSGSQARINEVIDIWPQRLKWHNIQKNERGQCRNQKELRTLLDGLFG